ncbi:MAG TPA: hypothetical protein VJ276_22065 [Thermoanaerobaculia bacterium]|nr:hypothetical protein [Thermoanaerobaculia bacterium]
MAVDNGVSISLLKDWLKVLEEAMLRMRKDQYIFRELSRSSTAIPNSHSVPVTFFACMYDNYVERMAMGVRRLRDARPGTLSIVKLLRRISGDPTVISRKHYLSLFTSAYMPDLNARDREAFIHRQYDDLVGVGLQRPEVSDLESEIAWLEAFGAPAVKYATKRIAHHDDKPPTEFPTLDDVDAFIEYAEELLRQYIILVGGPAVYFDTSFVYDRLAPLRVPWIPGGDPVTPATEEPLDDIDA